ncbi:hypothetical protein BMIN_1060 [Bifidobacterium minimum]|uniref:DNA-binding protein n=1 Tax=Bifidobacterium minimum TaxID=1693 RepID=A0A087BRH5_9BIFI|nr:DUF177 domain-containing protein [Bifidobacterium minimum]KFI73625.1 hypothetical protein BMIN_1060 [Bifidobacterium minimum]
MPHNTPTPWTVPLASLSIAPGHTRDLDATVPAPSGIGDEVIGVDEGDDVTVVGTLDSVVDGVLLTGRITAPVHASCSRCLTPLDRDWTIPITTFFPYDGPAGNDHDGNDEIEIIAGEEESGDVYPLSSDGKTLDLEAPLRDTLTEALPLQPLCHENCRGLCPQCGVNLNEHPDHHHDVTDIRFAELQRLRDQLAGSHGDGNDANEENDGSKRN